MTSKNSFSNLLLQEWKQKLWVFTLSSLTFFFCMLMPIFITVNIAYNPIGLYGTDKDTMISDLVNDFNSFVSLDNYFLGFLLIALGLMSALASFHYLNHKRKIEFYHCLPIKREKWFAIHTVVAFGNVLIPYFILSLLSAILVFANTMKVGIFAIALTGFVMHIPFFAIGFATAMLAIMLTGKVLINILATLTLYFYIPLCSILLYLYKSTYLQTFYETNAFPVPFSPFIWMFHAYFENPAIDATLASVCSILLLVLSLSLYKIRPSEKADNAMVFPILKAPIKCLIVILTGLWGALVLSSIKHSLAFGLFGLFLGVIISHCIIEIIYHGDFKKLFANIWHLVVCGIISILVFIAFFFDMFGYDSYVPKESTLESIGIYTDVLEENADFYRYEAIKDNEIGPMYRRAYDYDLPADLISRIKISDTKLAIAIAKRCVEKNIDDTLVFSSTIEYSESDTPIYIYIKYNLKSGHSTLRKYQVYYDDIQDLLSELYAKQEFKDGIYPILTLQDEMVSFDYLHFTGNKHVPVSEVQAQKLWNAYRKDLYGLTQETRESSQPFANIRFNTKQDENILKNMRLSEDTLADVETYVNYYPIYDTFTETIKVLEEDYSMNVSSKPLAQDVTKIEDSYNRFLIDGDEKDTIEKILHFSIFSALPYESYVSSSYRYYDTTITVHTATQSIEMSIETEKLQEILE